MYSEDDLESAIQSGALTPDAAAALRAHVAARRATPAVDEENIRLVSSFNDVFVVIACTLLLIALATLGGQVEPWLGALLVTGAAWALSEFFARRRRMALPSILLSLAFVGGACATVVAAIVAGWSDGVTRIGPGSGAIGITAATVMAVVGAGAALLYWRRFRVPVAVATGIAALVGGVVLAMAVATEEPKLVLTWSLLPLGLAVFGLAMWWDARDRQRITVRSDVAFWLHLLAAPLIVHPLFTQLGALGRDGIGAGAVGLVLALYAVLALVSLTIDRRALMVSALAYVLVAVSTLLNQFGMVGINVAVAALVISSALLLLSAFWQPARRWVVGRLPARATAQLPAVA